METWKDIPGYEGIYQASDSGQIRSIDRIATRNDGIIKPIKGRILRNVKTGLPHQNYRAVTLSKNGKSKLYRVHRLVISAFLFVSKNIVDHIDGDETNNNLSNLRYCTHRENASFSNRRDYNRLTSKFVGVSKRKNKWVAYITVDYKIHNLGVYENELDAHNAYQNKLKQIL